MGLAFLLGSVGLTLDGLRRAHRETSRLAYLSLPAVTGRPVSQRQTPGQTGPADREFSAPEAEIFADAARLKPSQQVRARFAS